jgi:trimeric autotransporter adhesin
MMANIIDDEVSEELPSLPEVNSENEKYSPFIKFPDLQVYPNPSKGEFTVSYEVVTRTNVELIILDTKGVLVKKIVDQKRQHEGLYHIPVQLTNLPDEIYLVQLIVGDKKLTEKLILKK